MDIAKYVTTNAVNLFEAGQRAYAQLGRGTLFCRIQVDQGNGKASVKYFTLAMMEEDQDKSVRSIRSYDPDTQVLFLVGVDNPNGVYLYRITRHDVPTTDNWYSVRLMDMDFAVMGVDIETELL